MHSKYQKLDKLKAQKKIKIPNQVQENMKQQRING